MKISTPFAIELEELRDFLADLAVDDPEAAYQISGARFADTFMRLHANMAATLAVDARVYGEAKRQYRVSINPILREAAIVRRNIDIPRGYHGDYVTMEMMYRNTYEGETQRGRLIHKIVADGRECNSVRERKRYLTSRILDLIKDAPEKLSICSIAAGPATELRSIPVEFQKAIARIVLLDQDSGALQHAFSRLPRRLQDVCECVAAPVTDIVNGARTISNCHGFDYVYSAGLFDYLNDATAKALVKRAVAMLRPNATLEVGNFMTWPAAFFADMSCGWRLILRNEDEMMALVPDQAAGDTTTVADQLFLSVRS